jgi:hypothetical protein
MCSEKALVQLGQVHIMHCRWKPSTFAAITAITVIGHVGGDVGVDTTAVPGR